jgi:hypothetical protein
MMSEAPQILSHCDNVTDVTGGIYASAHWASPEIRAEGKGPAKALNVTSVVTSRGLKCHNRGVGRHIRGGFMIAPADRFGLWALGLGRVNSNAEGCAANAP